MTTAAPSLRSGHTATTQAFMLSLVTPDSGAASRIRDLVGELDDIATDRHLAAQYRPETTGAWLDELDVEERHCWRELRATTQHRR